MTRTTDPAPCGLDEVIITHELEGRPRRAPDHRGENQALGALAAAMADAPDTVLQRLVETAMTLTGSDSAGISLLESGGENGTFRWAATAGTWAPYRDGTMAREESPCGEVIARERVLLLKHPERAFPALLQAEPGIGEGLLAPFHIGGKAAGTVWVIMHDSEAGFDSEDARVLGSLARFAAAGWQAVQALEEAKVARRGTEQHLQLALDAAKMGTFTWYPQEDRTEPDERTWEMYGLEPGTEMNLETSLATIIHPDDREHYADAARRAIDPAGEGRLDEQVRIIRPDKSIRWISINGDTHFEGPPPRAMRMFGTVSDITEAKEAEERQAFLLCLGDTLRAEPSPEAIANRALRMLLEQMRLDHCYVGIYRLAEDIAEFPQQVQVDGLSRLPAQVRLSDFPEALRVSFERTLVVDDALEMESFSDSDRASFSGLGLRAVIAATLRKGENNPLWAIVAGSASARVWTQSEVSLVEEVAERTWAAVERARAEAALRESEERQAFLLKLSDALRPIADPLEIQMVAMRVLGEQLGIVGAQYYESDDDGEHFNSFGGFTDGMAKVERVRLDDFGPFTKEAYRAGRTLVVDDVWHDDRITPEQAAAYKALDVCAYVGVPLIKAGRLVVALGAVDSAPKRWTKDETALIEEAAQRTWAAVERARAEAALRESEERFSGFAENSADVLWIVNAGTRKLEYLSPAFEQVWGERREAVMEDLGRWAELVHPDDREQAAQGMPRLLTGETYTGTYRIVRPDGAVRWIRDTGFPIHEDGVARVGGIAQDITDLKAAEAAVSEREERYRLIVENARDYAILISDPDDIITDWLPGSEAVFGWTRDEAVGRPAGIIFTPEDRAERVPEQEIETAAREGEAPDIRWHQRKDGSHVFIEGMTTPLYNDDGSIRGYLKIGQDVSERRHAQEALEASERRMRSLATGIPQLVFRSLGTGHRIWGSPQWIEYTGISFEDSVGYGWVEGIHPDDRETTLAAWEDVEERGEYYCEHRILRAATGHYCWHQTRATPSRDEKGNILEWLGTSSDVEELRGLQRRQQMLLAELQHRVRNILAMIRSVSRRTAETSDTVEDYAQHLEGRIGAMARTQAILTRRPGAGVDLEEIVQEEMLSVAAREQQYWCEGPEVMLEPKAAEVLTLAIHELATNSIKYGALSQASGQIEIGWKMERRGGERWLVLHWEEARVAGAPEPRREGFGTELITRRVPYELGGTGELAIEAGGIKAAIEFPLREGESVLDGTPATGGIG